MKNKTKTQTELSSDNEYIIEPLRIYATMNQDELLAYIEKLSDKERSLAYLIRGLTWNMIAQAVNTRP